MKLLNKLKNIDNHKLSIIMRNTSFGLIPYSILALSFDNELFKQIFAFVSATFFTLALLLLMKSYIDGK